MRQQTLRREIRVEGKGLHTGQFVTVDLLPAEEGYGICFERTDLPENPFIPALSSLVSCTQRNTTISLHGVGVATTEHLLAALYGMGIDNVHIRINGPEVPVLDGSALFFAQAIQEAGVIKQEEGREYAQITSPLIYEDAATGTAIKVLPSNKFSLSVEIDFKPRKIGKQVFFYDEDIHFIKELAPARTFVFLDELVPLLKKGLIQGGDLDNALVIADGFVSEADKEWLTRLYDYSVEQWSAGYLNKEGPRYPNECVRHKTVDLLGDLYLVGKRLKASVQAYKPGHKANVAVAQMIRNHIEKHENK